MSENISPREESQRGRKERRGKSPAWIAHLRVRQAAAERKYKEGSLWAILKSGFSEMNLQGVQNVLQQRAIHQVQDFELHFRISVAVLQTVALF